MIHGQDNNNQLVIAPQTVGLTTAATTGGFILPYFEAGIVLERSRVSDPLAGASTASNALDPYPGTTSDTQATFTATVPLDTMTLKRWLDWAFGTPTTTGSAPNLTHSYVPAATGGSARNANGYTIALRSGDSWDIGIGMHVTALGFELSSSAGRIARMTIQATGASAILNQTTSPIVSPAALPTTREIVSIASGSVTRDAAAVARINSASVAIATNVEVARDVGGAGIPGQIERLSNEATLDLSLRAFNQAQLAPLLNRDTASTWGFNWSTGASRGLFISFANTFCRSSTRPVQAGEFVTCDASFRAEQTIGASPTASFVLNLLTSVA